MNRCFFISCGKDKSSKICPARSLYTGDLFKKTWSYVESIKREGDFVFILSARHGLVTPDQMLAPYNLSMSMLTPAERRLWALKVTADLVRFLEGEVGDQHSSRFVSSRTEMQIHAGASYHHHLADCLRAMGWHVTIPNSGLGIGELKSWYLNHTPQSVQA